MRLNPSSIHLKIINSFELIWDVMYAPFQARYETEDSLKFSKQI